MEEETLPDDFEQLLVLVPLRLAFSRRNRNEPGYVTVGICRNLLYV
jgi:hypothetical protein